MPILPKQESNGKTDALSHKKASDLTVFLVGQLSFGFSVLWHKPVQQLWSRSTRWHHSICFVKKRIETERAFLELGSNWTERTAHRISFGNRVWYEHSSAEQNWHDLELLCLKHSWSSHWLLSYFHSSSNHEWKHETDRDWRNSNSACWRTKEGNQQGNVRKGTVRWSQWNARLSTWGTQCPFWGCMCCKCESNETGSTSLAVEWVPILNNILFDMPLLLLGAKVAKATIVIQIWILVVLVLPDMFLLLACVLLYLSSLHQYWNCWEYHSNRWNPPGSCGHLHHLEENDWMHVVLVCFSGNCWYFMSSSEVSFIFSWKWQFAKSVCTWKWWKFWKFCWNSSWLEQYEFLWVWTNSRCGSGSVSCYPRFWCHFNIKSSPTRTQCTSATLLDVFLWNSLIFPSCLAYWAQLGIARQHQGLWLVFDPLCVFPVCLLSFKGSSVLCFSSCFNIIVCN